MVQQEQVFLLVWEIVLVLPKHTGLITQCMISLISIVEVDILDMEETTIRCLVLQRMIMIVQILVLKMKQTSVT